MFVKTNYNCNNTRTIMEKNIRDSFVFYRSFYEAIKLWPEENQLSALKAIIEYALNGKEDITSSDAVVMALVKPQIDKNNKRYENGKKGAEYGELGGRPKKPLRNPQ